MAVLDAGEVSTFKISPRNAGLPEATLEDLTGGDAVDNAAHIRAVLGGLKGPFRDIVLLNASAALLVAGKAAIAARWRRARERIYRQWQSQGRT